MTQPSSSDADDLMTVLRERFDATAADVVPWFLSQMPQPYFQDTPEATRIAHLMAIVASRASQMAPRLILESSGGAQLTFIEARNHPGLLAELMEQLPRDRPLSSAKVHTAADESLVLDVFRFGNPEERFDPDDPTMAAKLAATEAHARSRGDEVAVEGLKSSFQASSRDYLRSVPPFRIYENHRLREAVRGTADTVVRATAQAQPGLLRIDVATGNADARSLFERVVSVLGHRGVDIARAYLDVFDAGEGDQPVTVLGFVVTAGAATEGEAWGVLQRDLQRLRWVDDRSLQLFLRRSDLSLLESEILVALADLAHARLAREDPFAFSRDRLMEGLERHLGVTRAIARIFLDRFDPDQSNTEARFEAQQADWLTRLEREVDAEHERRFVSCLMEAVQRTLRTNVYVHGRYGLSLRLDPTFFARVDRAVNPFGVFFVHGRGFDGFHVRFADIARGGVRVVRPRGPEQHELEAERVFEEAYDLAFAQQLKNKDIPEGGSKAVILAEPDASVSLSVQAFADSLLDLISSETRDRVVDRLGRTELLFLGPDENISPELIEWVVERARVRGYALPDAFMSSKPGAGINHKEFGVTSEGVTVFLEEALRAVGIDPATERFTVKLTGGPDGDVAGNELRILARDFGSRAKVVAIADGSGSAHDPEGLDMQELLRLVDAEAPIAGFSPALLSPHGQVVPLDAPDGLRLRNNLCFEVYADVFVPAGGRPQTIHVGNWRRYLDREGRPSSKVIVEGANLFITPEARAALEREAGVVVVKDSSANKCGVICSSFEITASMMLSPEEFIRDKPVFVAQVLDRLRVLARREAQLLFREKAKDPGTTLPDLSVAVSRTILRTKEAIRAALPTLEPAARALLDSLVQEHLPESLRAHQDRIPRLPEAYRDGIIAASLATRLVYREGIDFLAHLPEGQLAPLAVAYLTQEREAARLAEQVAASDLVDRDRIAALLLAGGARGGLTAG
ncbi:MAG: NAD-glutamate dehydrogenase [Myxococcales bacterium]|nr:NAD-glutamate dehydrogenase [Myxococcales bacterium]